MLLPSANSSVHLMRSLTLRATMQADKIEQPQEQARHTRRQVVALVCQATQFRSIGIMSNDIWSMFLGAMQ